jgi:hypothetical protein
MKMRTGIGLLAAALGCQPAERSQPSDTTPNASVAAPADPITQELVVYRSPT